MNDCKNPKIQKSKNPKLQQSKNRNVLQDSVDVKSFGFLDCSILDFLYFWIVGILDFCFLTLVVCVLLF